MLFVRAIKAVSLVAAVRIGDGTEEGSVDDPVFSKQQRKAGLRMGVTVIQAFRTNRRTLGQYRALSLAEYDRIVLSALTKALLLGFLKWIDYSKRSTFSPIMASRTCDACLSSWGRPKCIVRQFWVELEGDRNYHQIYQYSDGFHRVQICQ